MKNDQLLALSENLLEEKAKALKTSGEMKKQKGKTGQIVFSIIFAISLIGGLFAEIIHVNFVWFGQTMDFHEIGQYLFYGSVVLDVLCLVFFLSYRSLRLEGENELKEAEKILHSPISR